MKLLNIVGGKGVALGDWKTAIIVPIQKKKADWSVTTVGE